MWGGCLLENLINNYIVSRVTSRIHKILSSMKTIFFLVCIMLPVFAPAQQMQPPASLHEVEQAYREADSLYKKGLYQKALPAAKKSGKLAAKQLGKTHPRYAASLRLLGNCYLELKKYKKAASSFQEAGDIVQKVLGPTHPEYAKILCQLGLVYLEQGNYKKSEPLLLEATQTIEKVLGKEHPEYQRASDLLKRLYEKMGRR
ncbi:MAG: tetratricopeptide repeat protein [Haliscomenobacteraceae bacterium CHB4]|nr:tetratricopeptide repeat protein [Haliscomenobacteraceae bacterium CHB4]